MGAGARAAIGWLQLVLVAACFSEPPLADAATTGEVECPMGGVGCACNGNGTCDVGLECAALIDVCVPADCMAGTEDCVCVGPDCLIGLACEGGICVAPQGGSDGDPASSSSSPYPSSSSGDEASTTLAVNEATGSTSSTAPDTTAGDDATTGPSNCWFDGEGCDECQTCIDDVVAGGGCVPQDRGCTGDCELLRGCHATGPSTGQCCLNHGESVGEYHALACCALTMCPSCAETLCTPDIC